jgi:uncharacterized membrane protein YphA (DoxX/SURF4 family)
MTLDNPRLRVTAMGLLWLALVCEVVWLALHRTRPVGSLIRPLIFVSAFLLVAVTAGRVRWIALVGRLTVAGAFLSALLPRFQDFGGFIVYTGRVNAFLPRTVIPTIAVVATIAECTLCVAMILGLETKWAAAGSAILLCLFATAMTGSGLSHASWAVYVLSAGALVLATTDASVLSVDGHIASRRRSSRPDSAA